MKEKKKQQIEVQLYARPGVLLPLLVYDSIIQFWILSIVRLIKGSDGNVQEDESFIIYETAKMLRPIVRPRHYCSNQNK